MCNFKVGGENEFIIKQNCKQYITDYFICNHTFYLVARYCKEKAKLSAVDWIKKDEME
jgi:hypothetical protein